MAKLTDAGPTGSFVWAQQAGGNGNEYANAVALAGNQVYVAGSFEATARVGSASLTSKGSSDILVAKWLDNGATANFEWAQQAGSEAADAASALACVSAVVYVAGGASPTATFGAQALNAPAGLVVGFLATLGSTPLAATNGQAAASTIFPNPAHASTTLQMGPATAATPLQLSLLTLLGQTARNYSLLASVTGSATLDLSGLAPGVYLLRGQAGGQTLATRRLVVE